MKPNFKMIIFLVATVSAFSGFFNNYEGLHCGQIRVVLDNYFRLGIQMTTIDENVTYFWTSHDTGFKRLFNRFPGIVEDNYEERKYEAYGDWIDVNRSTCDKIHEWITTEHFHVFLGGDNIETLTHVNWVKHILEIATGPQRSQEIIQDIYTIDYFFFKVFVWLILFFVVIRC